MLGMASLSSKHKYKLEEEEKVPRLFYPIGYLTSGMKGGVQILKTPQEVK
jgi:hypothetical protein